MRDWFHRWLERLGQAQTAPELSGILVSAIIDAGFDCIACGEIDIGDPRRSSFLVNTWPPEYFDLYRKENVVEFDPLIARMKISAEPVSWPELVLTDPRQRWILNVAKQFGWIDGLAVPIARGGSRFGLISLASRTNAPVGQDRQLTVEFLKIAYERLRGAVSGGEVRSNNAGLTSREIECLGLVAKGMSDGEIGMQLGISAATAHEYIERAKKRLRARNRPHAVAIAVGLQLLS